MACSRATTIITPSYGSDANQRLRSLAPQTRLPRWLPGCCAAAAAAEGEKDTARPCASDAALPWTNRLVTNRQGPFAFSWRVGGEWISCASSLEKPASRSRYSARLRLNTLQQWQMEKKRGCSIKATHSSKFYVFSKMEENVRSNSIIFFFLSRNHVITVTANHKQRRMPSVYGKCSF